MGGRGCRGQLIKQINSNLTSEHLRRKISHISYSYAVSDYATNRHLNDN